MFTRRKKIRAWQQALDIGTPIRGVSYILPFRATTSWEARVIGTFRAGAIIENQGIVSFLEWGDLVDYCEIIRPGDEVADLMEEMNAEL